MTFCSSLSSIIINTTIYRKYNRQHCDVLVSVSALDALCISMERKLMEQQRDEEERRRELARELVQYWAMDQRSEDARDADINYNRQERPGVSLANQESLGPASMQVFQVVYCCVLSSWGRKLKTKKHMMAHSPNMLNYDSKYDHLSSFS